MSFVRESVVVTLATDGRPHIAPLGVIEQPPYLVLAPFRPSRTLDHLERHPFATVNYVDDVRILAGCVTGRRRDWPVVPAVRIPGFRLKAALAHSELEVVRMEADPLRPRFLAREVHFASHRPFLGFNRARHAVVEGAILISRLHLLPRAQVEAEFRRLRVLVEKTAGEAEWEAWRWLEEALAAPAMPPPPPEAP